MGTAGSRAGADYRDGTSAESGAEEDGSGKIPSCRGSLAVLGVARAIERMGVAARNRRGEADGRGKDHGRGHGKGDYLSSGQTGLSPLQPRTALYVEIPRRDFQPSNPPRLSSALSCLPRDTHYMYTR